MAWNVEGDGQAKLLSEELDPVLLKELRHVASSNLTGCATVEYLAEEDDRSKLGLSIQAEGTKGLDDVSELAGMVADSSPRLAGFKLTRCDVQFTLEAVGTATWHSKRGHLVNVQLDGKMSGALTLEVRFGARSERSFGLSAEIASTFSHGMGVMAGLTPCEHGED